MSLSINEIIKFIIDNNENEVDVDDLLQHLWNIKLNQRIIIINNDEEIVEEEDEEEEDDEDDDEVPED